MYPIEFFDCDGECWNDSDFDGICDELEVVGCDDLEACNYSMNVSESCEDVDMDGIPDCCTYPILYYYQELLMSLKYRLLLQVEWLTLEV